MKQGSCPGEEDQPDDEQVPLLGAEMLVVQDRLADAEKLLERARLKNPSICRTLDYAGLNCLSAKRTGTRRSNSIEEAQAKWGDTVLHRLAMAQLLAQRDGAESIDRLRKLAENVDKFSDSDRQHCGPDWWRPQTRWAIRSKRGSFANGLPPRIQTTCRSASCSSSRRCTPRTMRAWSRH